MLTSSPTSTCTADGHKTAKRMFSHLLEPLADNGGLSQALALRPGSMALDTGLGSCSGHDQRRQRLRLSVESGGSLFRLALLAVGLEVQKQRHDMQDQQRHQGAEHRGRFMAQPHGHAYGRSGP